MKILADLYYATPSIGTSRLTQNPLPRPPPHLRNNGTPKRSRCKDRVEYPWSLLRRLYPRYLRPRNHSHATNSSRKSRAVPRSKYPVRVKNGSRTRNPKLTANNKK